MADPRIAAMKRALKKAKPQDAEDIQDNGADEDTEDAGQAAPMPRRPFGVAR